ncbi:MAG: hypothetical protein O7H41_10865 [Planctomycetota bacterium]|nr:hypothetical protein [Planctomycetota bacterium]
MNDQACAYPGCPNAPDDTVLDGPTREKIREGVIYMNREGVFDFPDPPTYRNSELCEPCWSAHEKQGNEALRAAGEAQDSETIRIWERDLGELEVQQDKSTTGPASLDGYRSVVLDHIQPPEKYKRDQA